MIDLEVQAVARRYGALLECAEKAVSVIQPAAAPASCKQQKYSHASLYKIQSCPRDKWV